MQGTPNRVNKALFQPQLLAGAEMPLVLLNTCFWGWVIGGMIPHLMSLAALAGYVLSLFALRFFAKRDPQGSRVFKSNSSFLLSKKVFLARGSAGHIEKIKKVKTIPVSKLKEL